MSKKPLPEYRNPYPLLLGHKIMYGILGAMVLIKIIWWLVEQFG